MTDGRDVFDGRTLQTDLTVDLVDICSLVQKINSRCRAGRSQVGKIIKVALSAALEATAARDLEPRSMQCLRRTSSKNKIKVARHFNKGTFRVIEFKFLK